MTYVIAEPCIGVKDTACVDACPVDCIHPKKSTTYDDGRPSFDEVSQLYIDPIECIDCGACVPVCPVSAIFARRRPARKVEAIYGNQRKLRPRRQIHARRVRQTPSSKVAHKNKSRPFIEPSKRSKAYSVFSSAHRYC